MGRVLVLFMLLWSSDIDDIRLLGGSSRCSGVLQVKRQGEWSEVDDDEWDLVEDSVRLVNRTSLCSGRLEVKSNHSTQSWSSVCEDDFDLQDAEVVCRELGCGAPLVLQGALYGDIEAPVWTKEFQCRGHESALLDCDSSDNNTCSSGKAVGLTCSEPDNLRLARGSSRCAGELEMKKEGKWSKVDAKDSAWNLKAADVVCRHLDCGSAVSTGKKESNSYTINCADSVRLVKGTSLCSGRLEVKSNQSTQSWSSVCEDDFDLQDAEVVCRQLGCGAPSVLQGVLYGDMEAPVWTKEFQCRGHESALLGCDSSDNNTCSSGKAVGLTCSEPDNFQLARGFSRCAGELEMKKKGKWSIVDVEDSAWNLKAADVVYSVRLVNGTSLCSGRLEVKSTQSTQPWSSVCEDNFDLQDAEVVCRELGCGAPSVLQGALYGDMEAPVWTKEFQCRGHESSLLDCDSSDRKTCSSGKAVGLTCSEPDVRLSGGASSCAGTPEMKQQGQWRPVIDWDSEWDQKLSSAVCKRLDCGSAVSTNISSSRRTPVWGISRSCVQSEWIVRECLWLTSYRTSPKNPEVVCSDLLAQPKISFSTHSDGVSEATQQGLRVLMGSNFTISCSVLPQYPGGSFKLIFNTSDPEQKTYTLPAVNHSAHFLFSAADSTHRGEYRCVYHLYVFSHNFSSESLPLHLPLAGNFTDNLSQTGKCHTDLHLVIGLVVLMVLLVLVSGAALFFYSKASRGQTPRREDNMEVHYLCGADDLLGEEAGGAQGSE
ncbi:scavenger receptor cysteine-rich type 1 protein M130-like [Perca fluviatilis]|uniref:scavenger receptor cysteine-rich type 1 protein M130-like n=1 Tax=Perca fluviatilis TaxID=8168 RepID=UPI0019627E5A|nr:scavenger receptor cysteine-rich type 1 protein M130-like [Perca fluviatilis]